MDAIILTGGRGRRLGALTAHHPKANLHFAGKILLAHTLSTLKGSENFIERIYIATGYQAEKMENQYRHDIAEVLDGIPITFLPVESEPSGTFGSAVWALNVAEITGCCLILGIDVIVAQHTMKKFIASIRNETRTTFMLSPMLTIAPTHGRIRLNSNGEISEYRKSSFCAGQTTQNGWYCDVGVRYFSVDFVEECRLLSLAGTCDFDDVVPSMVDKGRIFSTRIIGERWLHFAHGRDFSQKPL